MLSTIIAHNIGQSSPVVYNLPSFLKFPAEIRNKIYHYLCHRTDPIRLYFYQDPESNTPKPVVPFASNTTIPSAFFSTCRQINAEASSVFYSDNIFLLNRRTKFATFIRPCFISALLKFFDVVGSRAALVRNVVFDTFNLCNSVFLRTYIDKTTQFFDPGVDIVEVTMLLRKAWDRDLNFKINLVDVADVEEDRAAYWMDNPDRVRATKVMNIVNSLLDGQLELKKYRDEVRAVAVKRDGSGGLIIWASNLHIMVEFTAKDGGTHLELVPRTLL